MEPDQFLAEAHEPEQHESAFSQLRKRARHIYMMQERRQQRDQQLSFGEYSRPEIA